MNDIIKKAKQIKNTPQTRTYSKRDQYVKDYTEVALAVISGEITINQVARAEKITKATAIYRVSTAPFHALRRGLATLTFTK